MLGLSFLTGSRAVGDDAAVSRGCGHTEEQHVLGDVQIRRM